MRTTAPNRLILRHGKEAYFLNYIFIQLLFDNLRIWSEFPEIGYTCDRTVTVRCKQYDKHRLRTFNVTGSIDSVEKNSTPRIYDSCWNSLRLTIRRARKVARERDPNYQYLDCVRNSWWMSNGGGMLVWECNCECATVETAALYRSPYLMPHVCKK